MKRVSPSLPCVAVLLLAAPAMGQSHEAPLPVLEATQVAAGFTSPAFVCAPPGENNRLFVLELPGRVLLVKDGEVQPTPFLDITDKAEEGAQSGLMGMVFHADYARNGWFYVYYGIGGSSSMVERYTVSATDPDRADPASALPMIPAPIVEPVQYHMGGGMEFGPDGKVYVGIGDLRDAPTNTCASQRLDTLLGKILRLNDDGTIPADNPFVGVPGARPEIWDIGLREPYRLDFDPHSGDLYIGEVGESSREELNVHRAGVPGGMNWGWAVMEGELCTGSAQCAPSPCPAPAYELPAYSFTHDGHLCCIVGSGVYRGVQLSGLTGLYVYGEYCTGNVYAVHVADGIASGAEQLMLLGAVDQVEELVCLGVDGTGELLLLDRAHAAGGAGTLWRLGIPQLADLGGALGPPHFQGAGAALAGQPLGLVLEQALPGGAASLVVGTSELGLPFKGGILVPALDAILHGFSADAGGRIRLNTAWPAGLPAGTPVLMQWWIADPAGPQGFTASNALQAVVL